MSVLLSIWVLSAVIWVALAITAIFNRKVADFLNANDYGDIFAFIIVAIIPAVNILLFISICMRNGTFDGTLPSRK